MTDRFFVYGSQASKFSAQQNAGSVTPPAGFTNYLGITSLSAYSITSSDVFVLGQNVEGFNAADLAWGTASAQTITMSFWVRSSLTGTFGGVVRNSANNRSYPFSYTISSANTWEQKVITIAGDTTGTWVTNNGIGLRIHWGLGVGSTTSGTAGAWSASEFNSATGATSVVGTNGATFYITGVQLEAGSVATPFERRDYGRELMMAQRYFYNIASGTSKPIGMGSYETATRLGFILYLPVTMRASPTIVQTTGTNYYYIYRNSAYDGFNSWNLDVATTNTVYFQNSSDVSGTVGQTGYISTDNASTYLSVSAEL
jgi:hypothetical protein